MSDYSIKELEYWNERLEELVEKNGLNCYNQEFELVSYEEMTAYEAYSGMPAHYPHWSYGKAYERIRTLNKYNLSGLPYEIVINSNPCIAYLMKDNTMLLQILTMAHVYAHNDFFRNNRLFRYGTRAEMTIEMFKNHAARVREYISDPDIGYLKVERILDAAHSLRYQCARTVGARRLDEDQLKKRIKERNVKPESDYPLLDGYSTKYETEPDFKKIPLEPEEDLLYFIRTYGRLEEWEKDIIDIVREETLYFIPQIETKLINEGWASFWHYKLLNEMNLPQNLHFEFIKRHNQVIKPYEKYLNPYYIGFHIFKNIYEKNNYCLDKIFEVREMERDQSFIRRYLTQDLCRELKLYEYEKDGSEYIVSEVSDEEGWIKIRDTLAASAGTGNIPVIHITDWNQKENSLLLEHIYDGRELELHYANETLRYFVDLWDGRVILNTVIDGKKRAIICNVDKKITIVNA